MKTLLKIFFVLTAGDLANAQTNAPADQPAPLDASTLTIGGRSISNFVEDIAASTPAVFAVDDGFSTRLALTNDLGLPIGVRVYDPSTNTVTLNQVSGIGPVNKAAVMTMTADRIAMSTGPLTSIYTDGAWAHVSLRNRTLTNNGNGIGAGGAFISTVNRAIFFTNRGDGKWTVLSGGVTYTNAYLLTGSTRYTGLNGDAGGKVWGQTNFFWLSPFKASIYAFKSDGVNIWSNNIASTPW
jgi:hypothetical protein